MFTKAKKDQSSGSTPPVFEDAKNSPADAQSRRAETRTPARPKPARQAPLGVPSLISADMVIKGEIRSEGEVQFDGEIDGDLHAKGLVIGEGASVRGQVIAEKVKVAGQVEGLIRATRVELTGTSAVRGDIVHTALMIEAGARFEGSCSHSENPTAEPTAAPTPRAVPDTAEAPAQAPLREAAPAKQLRRDVDQAEDNTAPMKQVRAGGGSAALANKANLR